MIKFPEQADLSWSWKDIDSELKAHNERYVFKSELHEKVLDERWVIVLSDTAYYKMEQDSSVPRRRKDLLGVHSVYEDPSNPLAFFVFAYKHIAMGKTLQALGNLGIGSPLDFSMYLQKRWFVCTSTDERFQWVVFFQKLIRDAWQRTLEASVIPAPEVYQFHAHTIKVNRHNKATDRFVALSDSWIYNLELEREDAGTKVLDKKWAFPISTIQVLRLTRSKDKIDVGPAVAIYFDMEATNTILKNDKVHVGKKGENTNDSHYFCFATEAERSEFVCELSRLYYSIANRNLPPNTPPKHLNIDAVEDLNVAGLVQRRSILKAQGGLSPDELKKQSISTNRPSVSTNSTSISGQVPAGAPFLSGTLLKFTNGGKGIHPKFVTVYPTGLIEWKDSPAEKKKADARMLSVNTNVKDLKNKKDLTEDERATLFVIQTTGKTLYFLAKDAAERKKWVSTVEAVLSVLKST